MKRFQSIGSIVINVWAEMPDEAFKAIAKLIETLGNTPGVHIRMAEDHQSRQMIVEELSC